MTTKTKNLKVGKKDDTQFGRTTRISLSHRRNTRVKVYAFILLAAFINVFFPTEKIYQAFDIPKEGDITKKAIVAPFTFDILKTDEELKRERAEAMNKVLPVVEYDYDITERMFKKFSRFFNRIESLRKPGIPDSVKRDIWADLKKDVSLSTIKTFISSKIDFENMLYIIDNILDEGISSALFVKDPKAIEEFKKKNNIDFVNALVIRGDFVNLLRDDKEKTVPARSLLVKEEIIEREKARLKKRFSTRTFSAAYELIYAYLSPNIFSLEEETARRRTQAAESVLKTRGKVVKDLEIVGKNKLVTPEIFRMIYSLKVAQENLRQDTGITQYLPVVGRVLLVTLILLLLFVYVETFKQALFRKASGVVAFAIIIALQYLLAVGTLKLINTLLLTMEWEEGIVLWYCLPMVVGPMLMTVLYDLETGCVYSAVSALLLGVLLGFEYKIMLIHLIGGLVAAAGVRNIRYRSHFFLSLLLYSLAYFFMITIIGLFKHGVIDPLVVIKNFGLAGTGGLAGMMLTIMLVWIFEKVFGATTNLTLIELSDMNSPVLKKLSITAPGTYHHSVLIGNLAESAAEAIGANPLKTRVLAYYHDIGKINKPEYFIENQVGAQDNLHERISPRMSALIIASHVKLGVELAKKYKLPPVVHDVIKEHHGTTLISFFYEKAKQMEPDRKILRDDFCYPGPKPSFKESALIMLADSVEAASRSLSDPTTSRLKGLVTSIIDGKIADGQLDNCDLTFIDMAKIKESFIPVLTGMFHARIEYPDGESKKLDKTASKRTVRVAEQE
jgi:putative nucleotidyltransferase with HDIG domain